MKRITAILLAVLVTASLFALDNFTYKSTSFAFRPAGVRSEAMGGANLADPGKMEAFYGNPSALADRRFGLQVPGVSVTMYNVSSVLSDESIDWKHIGDKQNLVALGTAMINSLGKGRSEILSADVALGLKVWQLGFSTNVRLALHAFRQTPQTADQTVIPEVNIAQTVAFALRLADTGTMKLDVGAAGHFVFRTYMLAQNANSIINRISGGDSFSGYLCLEPVMGGYAIPFDVGTTLTLFDSLKIAATLNNINGNYRMNAYGSFLGMTEKLGVGIDIGKPYDKTVATGQVDVKTPMTLNMAAAFHPSVKFLDPSIEIDFVDILGFAKDASLQNVLKHMNIGAEMHLSPVLALRAGANAGNLRFGAQLNLWGIQIDASYGWMELGDDWGDKRTDFATIRLNIGSDR